MIAAEPTIVRGREVIEHEGELLPCGALSDVLRLPPQEVTERRACAIVTAAGERAALLVDEVLGDREVLVKDFEPPLMRIRNVAAAGLLGGGELVLVLRTAGPDRRHRRAAGRRRGRRARRPSRRGCWSSTTP